MCKETHFKVTKKPPDFCYDLFTVKAKFVLLIIFFTSAASHASSKITIEPQDLEFFQNVTTVIRAAQAGHDVRVQSNSGARLAPGIFSGTHLDQVTAVDIFYQNGRWTARHAEVNLSDFSVITIKDQPLMSAAKELQYAWSPEEVQFFSKVVEMLKALDFGHVVIVEVNSVVYRYTGFVHSQILRIKDTWEFAFPRGVHHTDFKGFAIDDISCEDILLSARLRAISP